MTGKSSVADAAVRNERRRPDSRRLEYRRAHAVSCPAKQAFEPLLRLGGPRGFYFANFLWSLRATLDRWVGGPGAVRRPAGVPLAVGDNVGMFRVARLRQPRELLLEGRMKVPGKAWLRFDIAELPDGGARVAVTATLETHSWMGRAYWASLYALHAFLFRGLLRRLAQAAGCAEAAASAAPPITAIRSAYRPTVAEKPSPCMVGCPSGTDIRGWITTVAQRKTLGISDSEAYERAWHMITEVNPFPAITGRICPHPCEGGCNRHDKDGAVSVKEMERFIGDWAIEHGLALRRLEDERKPETIGVIGSGPAGLSFAYQMVRRGYAVTVYERQAAAGGMLRFGIPVYRLPVEVVDAEVGRILDLGVSLCTGVRIGDDVSVADLQARHDVVFLGIGASVGRPLGIPGEQGSGVATATAYLESVRCGDPLPLGDRVAVIGGGDVAMDAARTARRRGAAVTVVYRRGRAEMPADRTEIDEAILEGIQFEFLAAPSEVVRDHQGVSSLMVRRMRLEEPDGSGRPRPVPVNGSDFAMPVTTVLTAVARVPDWNSAGLERPDGGESFPTGTDGRIEPGLWTGGDVLEPGVAATAIAHGRRAAEGVHARLRDLPLAERDHDDPVRVGVVRPQDYAPRERSVTSTRDPANWLAEPDTEIHRGIDEAQFLEEADRCLSCGSCFGCERCLMYCAHGCFSRLDEVRPGAYFALSLDQCQSCGKCVDLCPCGHLGAAGTDGTPRLN